MPSLLPSSTAWLFDNTPTLPCSRSLKCTHWPTRSSTNHGTFGAIERGRVEGVEGGGRLADKQAPRNASMLDVCACARVFVRVRMLVRVLVRVRVRMRVRVLASHTYSGMRTHMLQSGFHLLRHSNRRGMHTARNAKSEAYIQGHAPPRDRRA